MPKALRQKAPSGARLANRILAHVDTWAAFDAACGRVEDAEGTFTPINRDTLIHSAKGKAYSFYLGRNAILENISADYARIHQELRSSLELIGQEKRQVLGALTKLRRVEAKTFKAALAVFDGEDARRAASPLGAAEREHEATSVAEERAWSALLAHPCATADGVQAKCEYLLTCKRLKGITLQADETATLLRSFGGRTNG